jgi:eukaryotic-like serine/threonine-protein kinase
MQPGRVVAGRFRVEGFVGSGGMGTVFRAIDATDGQRVALKVLRGGDRDLLIRFADEALLLAELRHSTIVRYVAHGTTERGEAYLAMEWLEGQDLAERLRAGPLGVIETLVVARRTAQALAGAHARGVVHRDIKPSNLYLAGGRVDELKLLDFGIARRLAVRGITATGLPIGTPAYMAPEQARADRDIDARADLFSLGAVLFECLTGRPAFAGDHLMAMLAKVVFEDVPRVRSIVPGVPAAVDALVDRLLAKDPNTRPADAGQLLAELEALVAASGSAEATARFGMGSGATPGTLTRRERVLVSVIVARPAREDVAVAATADPREAFRRDAALAERLGRFGADLEALADGSRVVVLEGRTNAKDLAVRAARAALVLAGALDGGMIALATGRGELRDGVPIGDAIDRAVAILQAAPRAGADAPRLLVDDVTAALLPARFALEKRGIYVELRGEGDGEITARTLLGRATPFVGREHEMRLLETLFDQSIEAPSARAAIVVGLPGVGKSRLREELGRALARRPRPPLIWSAGDTPRSTAPLALAAELIRHAFGVVPGDSSTRVRRRLRERLAERLAAPDVQRVAAVLAELLGVPDLGAPPVSARGDARLGADRLRRGWLDWLEGECNARPIVISLEDAHAADAPTLALVDAALRELSERPLFVVAFARPTITEAHPGLWSARGPTRVDLHELSRAASVELARSVLGSRLGGPALEALAERAAGNAFYLEELVRRTAEGHADDRVPETVLAMAEARLAELTDDDRRLLRAASVFGRVFWRGGLVALLGAAQAETIDARLDELAEREFLVRRRSSRFAGEREHAFRHALLCEAAYATLVDADRTLGHRLAAAWLETLSPCDAPGLARHHDLGGEPERAVPWHVVAAEDALAKNDLAGAVASAEAGVASGAFGPALGALRLAEAEARVWLGQFKEAEQAATAALGALVPASASWFAGVGVAVAAAVPLGHVDDVRALVDAIVHAAPTPDVAPAGAIAAARVASHLAMAGRHEWVDRLAAWVAALAPALGELDPLTTGHIELARGMRALAAGDFGVLLAAMRRASSAFESAGDLRRACRTQANAGFASSELGRYEEAEQDLRSALHAASRAGIANAEAYARHNLGAVLARRDRLVEARELELAAIAAAVEQGDKRLEAGSHTCLAQILLREGDRAAAREHAEVAARLAEASPLLRASALGTLAGVLLASGEIGPAHAAAREAHDLVEAHGGIGEDESLVRLNHARALEAIGSPHAPAAFRRARERLLARSRALSDPSLVPAFLRDIPENAAILARAAELDRLE